MAPRSEPLRCGTRRALTGDNWPWIQCGWSSNNSSRSVRPVPPGSLRSSSGRTGYESQYFWEIGPLRPCSIFSCLWMTPLCFPVYFITGSRSSNSDELKKSLKDRSNPSQIFLIVRILGSLLFPYSIFLMEEGGNADNVASLLIVIFRSAHRCNILSRIAERVSMLCPTFFFYKHTKLSLQK